MIWQKVHFIHTLPFRLVSFHRPQKLMKFEMFFHWCQFYLSLSVTTMLVSVPFMIITIIVYAAIPELLYFSVKMFLCYMISLTGFFISYSLIQLNGSTDRGAAICKIVASMAYFSFLSTATWANAISFEIERNILKLNPRPPKSLTREERKKERNKLLLFMAYAWGLPALLLTISHIIDSFEFVPKRLRPGIGNGTCFIKGTNDE